MDNFFKHFEDNYDIVAFYEEDLIRHIESFIEESKPLENDTLFDESPVLPLELVELEQEL
ncbi:hypothetical protein D3C76_1723230 [compost metagenome]